MIDKDYKAIAGIINNNEITKDGRSMGLSYFGVCSDLADYFEKTTNDTFNSKTGSMDKIFNKKQFLKDCGVEE